MDNTESPDRAEHDAIAPDTDPLRPMSPAWETYSDLALAQWYQLLSQNPDEGEVQRFLELHPAMIPGGSGDIGPGGHHGSDMGAVFRRPKLIGSGRTFEPDFMWVTRSSGLITPILIEIEKPSKRWFRNDGRPTSEFSEARDQLNDWRSWFAREGNQSIFRETFLLIGDKYRNRPLEPQYVLIYGRESEFKRGGGHMHPDELRYKRDQQRSKDESFMTFDALRPRYDHRISMTLTMTAYGPKIHAFSPMYGTDAFIGEGALVLGDPQTALARSVMMSEERRAYLAQRWAYWQDDERRRIDDPSRLVFRTVGTE
ncbi:Shedu anti-phage system protein SduA domain-containing protein [Streptomyces sp. NPDC102351]|uniref:Shedu anti-phage system protein SduA domain-containing protein n=1 Tax=Streptomyces sp. NPDC102351 TaxID=3366158 RepID=UPI00382327E0